MKEGKARSTHHGAERIIQEHIFRPSIYGTSECDPINRNSGKTMLLVD